MVIESLKAAQSALKEAMKDKDMSEASRKHLQASDAALQKLLEEARKAAKEAGTPGYEEEEEAGMTGEEVAPMAVKPGHKMTKTVTVKHDGPADGKDGEEEESDGDGADGSDGDEEDEKDGDAAESHRGYIRSLLKEAGIPKNLWSLDKLSKLSLKEAKAKIADKKALIEEVRKANDVEYVPAGDGQPLHESDGALNLNGLFNGCAR